MSFSFNFCIKNETSGTDDGAKEPEMGKSLMKDRGDKAGETIPLAEAAEIQVDWCHLMTCRPATEHVRIDNDLSMEVTSCSQIDQEGGDSSSLTKAQKAHSDLLPHVYEGGLKIWECSVDLVQFLSSLQIAFRGMHVLELGCGAGLPGLHAYCEGAHVTFQDYNAEVLSLVTAVNIMLHVANKTSRETVAPGDPGTPTNCRLIAGDWSNVEAMLSKEEQRYDYILTSETIYSPESYGKLHDIMETLLKPGGTVYLAAKTYYFGVGGGIREFESELDARGVFSHAICREYTEGVQREIMKLTHRPPD